MQTATKSPWTTDFRHMVAKRWVKPVLGATTATRKAKRPVHTKDRIRQWNIVPGDQVRLVRGLTSQDPPEALREVLSIDKEQNRVYLKGSGVQSAHGVQSARHYHYSNIQLFIGEREFPAAAGKDGTQTLPIFASRLSSTRPTYVPALRRYMWSRYAVSTSPAIPIETSQSKAKILIPWPTQPRNEPVAPSSYDTPSDIALTRTWWPAAPVPIRTHRKNCGKLSIEDTYLAQFNEAALRHRMRARLTDMALPMEQFLEFELSNPHSRAKKQERWQGRIAAKSMLKTAFITSELKNLDGRTRQAARRDGVFMWEKEQVKREKDRTQRRADGRGAAEKVEMKKERKVRKEQRRVKKLIALDIVEGPNVVLPGKGKATTVAGMM